MKKVFNLKTSFCDHKFGWGLNCVDGSLIHNETIMKTNLKVRQASIINSVLDINEGTLKFYVDGVESENYLQDDMLRKGPIWFAVALNNETCVIIL